MATLRTHNNRRRRASWVEPETPRWTIEDTVRAARFIQNYSMGARKLKDYAGQLQKTGEAGPIALAAFATSTPIMQRLYAEMEARLKGEQVR